MRIHVENGESKSLVKLSQFCYGFKDIRMYRKSSEGVKVTVKAVQQSTVALLVADLEIVKRGGATK